MVDPEALGRIRVVLSGATHPGNIGAAARAMKTMGLDRLCLVKPKRFPDPEATAMASNADDVLTRARVSDTLDDALAGTTLAVAVSGRVRVLAHPPQSAREAAVEALAHLRAAGTREVAFVFGNETAGLTNAEVLKCGRLACIPTDPAYRSLNLGAAVQVIAYECRMAASAAGPVSAVPSEPAAHEEVENFLVHLERSLLKSGFLDPENPRRLSERLRRLFLRASLEKEEVNILRGMLSAWDDPRPPREGTGK